MNNPLMEGMVGGGGEGSVGMRGGRLGRGELTFWYSLLRYFNFEMYHPCPDPNFVKDSDENV